MRKECGNGQIRHNVIWCEPIRVGHEQHGYVGKNVYKLCLVVNKRHFAAHHIGVCLQSFGPDQAIGQ